MVSGFPHKNQDDDLVEAIENFDVFEVESGYTGAWDRRLHYDSAESEGVLKINLKGDRSEYSAKFETESTVEGTKRSAPTA